MSRSVAAGEVDRLSAASTGLALAGLLVVFLLGIVGLVLALAAVVTGSMALDRPARCLRDRLLGLAGVVLGVLTVPFIILVELFVGS